MFGGSTGGEIAVALALLTAERADAFHVAQQQRLGLRKMGLVDAERLEQLWQFIRGVRSLTDQPVQVVARNPEVAGDTIEISTIQLADIADLPPVFQPVAKNIDHI